MNKPTTQTENRSSLRALSTPAKFARTATTALYAIIATGAASPTTQAQEAPGSALSASPIVVKAPAATDTPAAAPSGSTSPASTFRRQVRRGHHQRLQLPRLHAVGSPAEHLGQCRSHLRYFVRQREYGFRADAEPVAFSDDRYGRRPASNWSALRLKPASPTTAIRAARTIRAMRSFMYRPRMPSLPNLCRAECLLRAGLLSHGDLGEL